MMRSHLCLACAGIVALASSACLPPPMNIGYVAMDPSGAGHVDIQGQVGAGLEFRGPIGGGGVAGQAEPFVAQRLSIPIGVGIGVAGANGDAAGLLPVRVGLRHRALDHFAWGIGLGPSVGFDSGGATVAGVADLELIGGMSNQHIGFSFGVRPAFSFQAHAMTFYALIEPTMAIPIGASSLTVGLLTGPFVTTGEGGGAFASGFLGVALGIHRRF